MSAYIVVDIEIEDPVGYEEYKASVQPSISAYGGRFLVRGGRVETLEGDWAPGRLVILEFATVERAKAWWASAEYAQPKAIRQATARSAMVVAEGVP